MISSLVLGDPLYLWTHLFFEEAPSSFFFLLKMQRDIHGSEKLCGNGTVRARDQTALLGNTAPLFNTAKFNLKPIKLFQITRFWTLRTAKLLCCHIPIYYKNIYQNCSSFRWSSFGIKTTYIVEAAPHILQLALCVTNSTTAERPTRRYTPFMTHGHEPSSIPTTL